MAIEIKDLTVSFGNGVCALNHIDLTIENGIYGLLGENGAGKTTLMRVLTTILKPTGGRVIINGTELINENYGKIQRKVGYLPQELGLYPNLTVREALEYMGGLSGVGKVDCKKRIDYYLERTNLATHEKKKNRQLSGGMKRRVGLIQALLHEPEILVIDEPTTGLDPEERIRIRNLIVDFSKNRTVLFSTHVVEDLAATCNSLGILKKGSIIYSGDRNTLLKQTKGQVWICKLKTDKEFEDLQKRYIVSSKKYMENGIEARIISEVKPDIPCQGEDASLEDGYIAFMNKI